jgi:hypothetical protein
MLISIRSMILAIAKGIGALGLGSVILWQVAIRSGCQNCVAYVHVSTPNVEVMVDDMEYHVETLWETPLVCELRPGRHVLRMSRSGRVLYEEEFTLGKEEEIVLTAWEPPSEKPAVTMLPDVSLNQANCLAAQPGRKSP